MNAARLPVADGPPRHPCPATRGLRRRPDRRQPPRHDTPRRYRSDGYRAGARRQGPEAGDVTLDHPPGWLYARGVRRPAVKAVARGDNAPPRRLSPPPRIRVTVRPINKADHRVDPIGEAADANIHVCETLPPRYGNIRDPEGWSSSCRRPPRSGRAAMAAAFGECSAEGVMTSSEAITVQFSGNTNGEPT